MARRSPSSNTLIFLLWLAGLGAAAQFAKFAVPFSALRAVYPDAGTDIGWVLTLISAVGAVLGMTAGVLVARAGLGKTLVLALILGAVMSLWQATLPDLGMMLLSRLIEGLSHLMIVVAAPTLIAQCASDRSRGFAMTLWSTFFAVSFALVAFLGMPLVAARGLESLLLAHGLFMTALAAILGVALARVPRPPVDVQRPLASLFRQHIDAYRSSRISAPAIGWLFYTTPFVSLLAVLPQMLPPVSRTAVVALMPLVSIAVALLLVSALLLRLQAVTITIVGFILAAAVVLLFFAGLPLPLLALALFAFLGLVQGASFAAVPELNKTNVSRALANGAMAQMGNIGNLLGTPLLLAVLGVAGHSGVLLSVAGLYLVGALSHVLLAHAR
jgi:MFS family permease